MLQFGECLWERCRMTTKEIIEIIISFLAGAGISAVVTLKVTKKSRVNNVIQTGNTAGGDIVGRDKR